MTQEYRGNYSFDEKYRGTLPNGDTTTGEYEIEAGTLWLTAKDKQGTVYQTCDLPVTAMHPMNRYMFGRS